MKEISFTCDENKNEINKKKHGLSFEKVKEVFEDYEVILLMTRPFD